MPGGGGINRPLGPTGARVGGGGIGRPDGLSGGRRGRVDGAGADVVGGVVRGAGGGAGAAGGAGDAGWATGADDAAGAAGAGAVGADGGAGAGGAGDGAVGGRTGAGLTGVPRLLTSRGRVVASAAGDPGSAGAVAALFVTTVFAVFLAGAFVACGVSVATGSSDCTGRRSPSASALRRTRSAWASSIDDEWLFTPMPSERHRSSASLLVSPSSRPSS
jgi:hypothetical protein